MPRYLFGLLIALCAWKVYSITEGECDESGLRSCLSTLLYLVRDEFDPIRKTEDELNDFCLTVQRDSSCLPMDLSPCKVNHSLLTAQSEAVFVLVNQVCNTASGRRKVYTKMIPCFEDYATDFNSCWYKRSKYEDQVKEACLEMKKTLCVADTSKKYCGSEGYQFGTDVERSLNETFYGICNAAPGVLTNFWIALLPILAFVLSKNKVPV